MKAVLVFVVGVIFISCTAGQMRYPQLQPVVNNRASYVQPRVGSAAALVFYEDQTERSLPWFPGGGLVTGGMNFCDPGNVYGSYRNLLDQATAEVYLLDLETSSFMPSIASLNFPRAFHGAFSHDNTAWVWGGGSNEIEYYDASGNHWIIVPTEGVQPEDRYAFGMATTADSLYIFGGVQPTKLGEEVRNDLFVLNLTTMSWSPVNSDTPIWPEARAGCSLDYIPQQNKLVLVGGTNKIKQNAGIVFQDMWFFDLDEWEWVRGQDPPFAGYGHATEVIVEEEETYLGATLGVTESWTDLQVYNVDSDSWVTFEKESNEVAPTTNFGFWRLRYDQWMVVGGGVFDEPLENSANGEMWYLDVSEGSWNRHECYPGFIFEFPRCVLSEVSSCPEYCASCDDYSVQRGNAQFLFQAHGTELYVSEIYQNLESAEFTGYLRQCPAVWRQ